MALTITNDQTFPYTIDKFALTNPSFVLTANGCSGVLLAPGRSCSFTVVFAPTGPGRDTSYTSIRNTLFCGTRRDFRPCSYRQSAPGIGTNSNFSVTDLPGGLRFVRWPTDGLDTRLSFSGVGVA